jgi:hypothetical protein
MYEVVEVVQVVYHDAHVQAEVCACRWQLGTMTFPLVGTRLCWDMSTCGLRGGGGG